MAGAEGSGADILGALSTTAGSVSKYKLELQLPSLRILPLLEFRVGRRGRGTRKHCKKKSQSPY